MSDRANRPVYKKITHEAITAIPDDLLAWALFDHIWFKVGKNYKRTPQVLEKLPPGFRMIYHLFVLRGEIGNGGFNQYFFNGLDKSAEQQLEALKLIRATQHRRILQKAFKIHNAEKKNEELQRRYAEQTIESFFSTYGMTKLDGCDKEWYALDKELDALQVKLIRSHPELFVTEKQEAYREQKQQQRPRGKVKTKSGNAPSDRRRSYAKSSH